MRAVPRAASIEFTRPFTGTFARFRNKATLAHPNDAVLEEDDAMLVINGVRTLLHYLNAKVGALPSNKAMQGNVFAGR
jgi:hypothetical protein